MNYCQCCQIHKTSKQWTREGYRSLYVCRRCLTAPVDLRIFGRCADEAQLQIFHLLFALWGRGIK